MIFEATAARVAHWTEQPEVLGVLLVGSRSRGHADALSDDDLEVILEDVAFARLAPKDCVEILVEGEGPGRKLIYDAQYLAISVLERKAASHHDLDRWPYERAQVLFDRDGRVAAAVSAAGHMDPEFRAARLRHATVDAWTASHRAGKTLRRGAEAAGRMLVARAAKALLRVLFALEGRWVPLDHWLEAELRTLRDPTHAAGLVLEGLLNGSPEPLERALAGLEELLAAEGVARPAGRRALFLELIHSSQAAERALHGLHG